MLAKGTYRARAVQGALGLSSKQNEQVGIEFEIVDGEAKGQHVSYFGSFTEAAFEFSIKALRACGWKGDDLADLSGITDNEVNLVIDHEEYDGKVRAKVKWVNPLGGLALKTQLTADQARAFAARMKGKVVAFNKQSGTPASSNGGKAPGDIPF